MATQTGSIDLKAQKEAHDAASQTASNYITEISNDGIMVHAEGEGPNDTQTPSGWHLSDVLEYIREGISRFWIGLKNSGDTTPTVTVRIGKEYDSTSGAVNEGRAELDYHSFILYDKDDNKYLHVSDLRDSNDFVQITEKDLTPTRRTTSPSYGIWGVTTSFDVYGVHTSDVGLVSVFIDGMAVDLDYCNVYTPIRIEFTDDVVVDSSSMVDVVYISNNTGVQAFTFGNRASGSLVNALSTSFGSGNTASGIYSFCEGLDNTSSNQATHAEGWNTTASGYNSHAEGCETTASGQNSHAEGIGTTASGRNSHAEGSHSTASGGNSHAEGYSTTASYNYSHAEGQLTTASGGNGAHAEGYNTMASGAGSHAEGHGSTARAVSSHAQNYYTQAVSKYQTTIGKYNTPDMQKDTFIGDGSTTSFTLSSRYDTILSVRIQNIETENYDTENNTTIIFDTAPSSGEHIAVEYSLGLYAFMIGNGSSSLLNTSNAATIDWNGNYLGQAMAGVIQMFGGGVQQIGSTGTYQPANMPGWLMCNGAEVSRTDYPELYAAIGDTWGAGDGSTTFNLPDLRGRAPIGAGQGSGLSNRALGGKVGAETHTLTTGQIPAHSHAFPYPAFGGDSGKLHYETGGALSGSGNKYAYIDGGSTNRYPASTNNNTGGGGAHNNMQPSAVVNFIICTGKTS